MRDRRTDVRDIPCWGINHYEMGRSSSRTGYQIITIKGRALESEGAVRPSAGRRGGSCDVRVSAIGRIIGAVLAQVWRAVENAFAANGKSAAFGETKPRKAN